MKKRFKGLYRRIRSKIPEVYGPRGWALIGFSFVALAFGAIYVGPFSQNELVEGPLGYEAWGYLWLISATWMIASAVKTDQSKALGFFSGIIFLTGAAYLFSGRPIQAVMFWGLSWACFCVGKMINPAEEHIEEVTKPGPHPHHGDEDHHGMA